MTLKAILETIPNDTIVCVENRSVVVVANTCKFVCDWLNYNADERANCKVVKVYPEYHKVIGKLGVTIEI